jgi:signal transduction histidine kinase
MSSPLISQEVTHLAKFRITRLQYLFVFLALLALVGVGVTTLAESRSSVSRAQVLSDIETPAASIIFTQRETLVYATRLAQWSTGGTSRREVQIARSLLAQRLAVIDSSGKSMGSRANSQYWKALRESDAIIAAAPMGLLPENLHRAVNTEISPAIDSIVAEARDLVVSYQRSVDKDLAENARKSAQNNQRVLLFFYLFLFFGSIFLISNVLTNFKSYRRARRILEAEQRRLEETIAALQETQGVVTKLQELDQVKDSFISTVNHELRTPLTSIIGYIELMRNQKMSEPDKNDQYLDVLERNAQILLNLVESMLTLSKIDSPQMEKLDSKVDIGAVLDNALFVLQPALLAKKIELTTERGDSALLNVRGDEGQLSQVLLNIIANAIKFSQEGSPIKIALSAVSRNNRPYVSISVTDHGIGIPEEDQNQLFTRFFRGKNAISAQFSGTGLGLSIANILVENHGGGISLSSIVGKGSTFTIALPAFPDEEELLIAARRVGVLERSIARLKGAADKDLKALTHEIGGAIGFYGFESQGQELLEISRAMDSETPENFSRSRRSLEDILTRLESYLKALSEA